MRAVREGKIEYSKARAIARVGERQQREELLEAARRSGKIEPITVRASARVETEVQRDPV